VDNDMSERQREAVRARGTAHDTYRSRVRARRNGDASGFGRLAQALEVQEARARRLIDALTDEERVGIGESARTRAE
jgi:hypothetical protein